MWDLPSTGRMRLKNNDYENTRYRQIRWWIYVISIGWHQNVEGFILLSVNKYSCLLKMICDLNKCLHINIQTYIFKVLWNCLFSFFFRISTIFHRIFHESVNVKRNRYEKLLIFYTKLSIFLCATVQFGV